MKRFCINIKNIMTEKLYQHINTKNLKILLLHI